MVLPELRRRLWGRSGSDGFVNAPFPWFGGKRRVASLVWERFGDVPNYVEPFAGSLAVLLDRPHEPRCETVNDLDGFVANFWRAMAWDAAGVCRHADWPVNEADLHARHRWLQGRRRRLTERLMTEPRYFDRKVAGWWVWGLSMWIGGGWCGEASRCKVPKLRRGGNFAAWRKRPTLKRGGVGVQRRRPMLLRYQGVQVHRTKPDISGAAGAWGRGVHASALPGRGGLEEYFRALQSRLRRVRVCCGDWRRVLGHSPTAAIGTTAVLLDPPYRGDLRDTELYAAEGLALSDQVREWAVQNGSNRHLRIALCGLDGEHAMPASWEKVAWHTNGGYANQSDASRAKENRGKERIWFSPHCLRGRQPDLFGEGL